MCNVTAISEIDCKSLPLKIVSIILNGIGHQLELKLHVSNTECAGMLHEALVQVILDQD